MIANYQQHYEYRSRSIHRIRRWHGHPQRVFYIPVTILRPLRPSNHPRDIQRIVYWEVPIGVILGTEVERIRVYQTGSSARVAEGRFAVMQAVIPGSSK